MATYGKRRRGQKNTFAVFAAEAEDNTSVHSASSSRLAAARSLAHDQTFVDDDDSHDELALSSPEDLHSLTAPASSLQSPAKDLPRSLSASRDKPLPQSPNSPSHSLIGSSSKRDQRSTPSAIPVLHSKDKNSKMLSSVLKGRSPKKLNISEPYDPVKKNVSMDGQPTGNGAADVPLERFKHFQTIDKTAPPKPGNTSDSRKTYLPRATSAVNLSDGLLQESAQIETHSEDEYVFINTFHTDFEQKMKPTNKASNVPSPRKNKSSISKIEGSFQHVGHGELDAHPRLSAADKLELKKLDNLKEFLAGGESWAPRAPSLRPLEAPPETLPPFPAKDLNIPAKSQSGVKHVHYADGENKKKVGFLDAPREEKRDKLPIESPTKRSTFTRKKKKRVSSMVLKESPKLQQILGQSPRTGNTYDSVSTWTGRKDPYEDLLTDSEATDAGKFKHSGTRFEKTDPGTRGHDQEYYHDAEEHHGTDEQQTAAAKRKERVDNQKQDPFVESSAGGSSVGLGINSAHRSDSIINSLPGLPRENSYNLGDFQFAFDYRFLPESPSKQSDQAPEPSPRYKGTEHVSAQESRLKHMGRIMPAESVPGEKPSAPTTPRKHASTNDLSLFKSGLHQHPNVMEFAEPPDWFKQGKSGPEGGYKLVPHSPLPPARENGTWVFFPDDLDRPAEVMRRAEQPVLVSISNAGRAFARPPAINFSRRVSPEAMEIADGIYEEAFSDGYEEIGIAQ